MQRPLTDPIRPTLPPIHHDPQLRRLWAVGMLMSLIRWLEILAFAVFTYDQTKSALWVASLMMLRLLPLSLFGLALGALASHMSRRRLLIVTHAGLFATCLLLLIVSTFGAIEVWHLAAASFVNGIVWAGDMPLRRALMGDLAGHGRMAQVMSLDAVVANACRLIGPILGGLLLARGGMQAVLLCVALLYLPVLVALGGLADPPQTRDAATKPTIRDLLLRGLYAARESRRLQATLWITILFNLFGWPVLSMIPVIGRDQLHLDAQGVGLLASLDGIGSLLGALALTSIARHLRHGPVYLGAVLLFLALQVAFAWSHHVLLTSAILFGIGVAQAGFAVMQSTLVYTSAPADRRADAMGLTTMCIGVGPLGFLAIGWLAERLGAPTAALTCAVSGLVAVALTWPLCRACFEDPRPAVSHQAPGGGG
jgi:MFS family permease